MSGSALTTVGGQAADHFRTARQRFFEYRLQADVTTQLALALAFAGLTGVAAQIRIPLPFTPVPITLQTFAVLLAGLVLGSKGGGASQALYIGIGMAGVPWFQGGGAGVSHLLGPTGGYIVGFVVAAVLVGWLTHSTIQRRRLPALLLVLALGNVVIYAFGLPWLYVWLSVLEGSPTTISSLLTMGLIPFIAGDLVKLVGAAAVGRAIAPGELPVPE